MIIIIIIIIIIIFGYCATTINLLRKVVILLCFYGNTRVYKLFSILQITPSLLGDATISSKTDTRKVKRRRREADGKVRNNKTM